MTKEIRKKYIDLAKKYGASCRCLNFLTNKDLCYHNNIFRNSISKNKIKIVPKIVYNKMNKYYEKPFQEEGFYEIIELDYLIDEKMKDTKEFKKIYYQYLE